MCHRAGLGDPGHKRPGSRRTKGIEMLGLDGPKTIKRRLFGMAFRTRGFLEQGGM